MEFGKNVEIVNSAEDKNRQQGPNLRLFKSIGRKIAYSPKIGGFQNKENAKNYGNSTNDRNDKENKQKPSLYQESRKKSSEGNKKKAHFLEITANESIQRPDLSVLNSNKAQSKPELEQIVQKRVDRKEDVIITKGISKDGQYQITSRALYAEDLKNAVELQHKMSLRGKKAAIKEMGTVVSPRGKKIMAQTSKTSNKQNGIIKAYAVNTHEGISRNYNEDRVSIILNITKNGVKSAFFAVYDGHGGSACCDFLSQHLHQYILNSKKFPSNPRQAIIEGMRMAEEKFIQMTKSNYTIKQELDRSGSCAIIALIVGDDCYTANLGDSRAVLSTCKGKPLYSLSRDHKPTDANEQARIFKEGGKIYRTEMQKILKGQTNKKNQKAKINLSEKSNDLIVGPLRVFPGKLSVTRTFGDIQAKDPQFGGIKNCIGTDPQICKYSLNGKEDFVLLGCDGIFERMDSEEVVEEAWRHLKKTKTDGIHQACGNAARGIVNACMQRKSTDNLTVIIIFLGSLESDVSLADYRSA